MTILFRFSTDNASDIILSFNGLENERLSDQELRDTKDGELYKNMYKQFKECFPGRFWYVNMQLAFYK